MKMNKIPLLIVGVYLLLLTVSFYFVFISPFPNPLFAIFGFALLAPGSLLPFVIEQAMRSRSIFFTVLVFSAIFNSLVIYFWSRRKFSKGGNCSPLRVGTALTLLPILPFLLLILGWAMAEPLANHLDKDWGGLMFSPGSELIFIVCFVIITAGLWLSVWLIHKILRFSRKITNINNKNHTT